MSFRRYTYSAFQRSNQFIPANTWYDSFFSNYFPRMLIDPSRKVIFCLFMPSLIIDFLLIPLIFHALLCIFFVSGLTFDLFSRARSARFSLEAERGQLICLLTLRLLKTTKIFSFLKKEIFLTMPSGIITNPKRSDRYFGNWANSTQIQYVTTCFLFTLRFMADLPLILSSLSVLSSVCSD